MTAPHQLDNPLYRLLHNDDVAGFNAQKPKEGPVDMASGDFRGLDLRGLDAARIDFTGAYFRGSDLRGLDLREASRVKKEEGVDILTKMKDPFHARQRRVAKPIIAAMTGHLIAGGMMLSLNSDLRVGLKGTQVGITETRIAGRGSPWAIPLLWMLPQPLLMEMVLTGELYPIETFHELRFINYLEDTPDAVRARAQALAERIRDNAPLSVMAGKESIMTAMSAGCEAGMALGLSKLETVWWLVLPAARPGIVTGALLALGHAMGETAPLLLIGMVAFVANYPGTPLEPSTALPVQIYMWANEAERAFVERTSGAIMVLLIFLILMNVGAILLRRRFERRW